MRLVGSFIQRDQLFKFELCSIKKFKFEIQQGCGRVALFGRKSNLSEDPNGVVKLMRKVVENDASSEEAVKIYHDQLIKKKITPDRDLQSDTQITDPVLKL